MKRIESDNLDFTVDTLVRVCDKFKVRRTAAGVDQKRGEGLHCGQTDGPRTRVRVGSGSARVRASQEGTHIPQW